MEINEASRRISGAAWFPYMTKLTATVAGVGGIGSHTAENIACLGLKSVILIDPQIVEAVNLAGQNITMDDIGKFKVTALSDKINKVAPATSVIAIPARVTTDTLVTRITFSCFDNMEARKTLFTSWYRRNKGVKESLFLDGRMDAQLLQIYSFRGCDAASIEHYQKNALFSSEEAEETICSYKQTRYVAALMGGYMADTLVSYVMKTYVNKYISIPYYREYDSPRQSYQWQQQKS